MSRPLAIVLLSGALVGCGGPLEETLIDELRVLAAPLDPPQAQPGDAVLAQPVVIDPLGEGFELLLWSCTAIGPPGTPCLEFSLPERATYGVVRSPAPVPVELRVPEPVGRAFTEGADEVIVDVRMLACAPGLCPIIAQVEGGFDNEDPSAEPVIQALSDPATLLRDLPLSGVSFARRDLRVVPSTGGSPQTNPGVVVVASTGVVAPGGDVELSVQVQTTVPPLSDGRAYGYATAGGFDRASEPVGEGLTTLRWLAPDDAEPGPVALIVVVRDDRGGEAVWRGAIEIR